MKTLVAVLLWVGALSVGAQTLDTLTFYQTSRSKKLKTGQPPHYTIAGKKVSEQTYLDLVYANMCKVQCTPCYAKFINAKGQLLEEGVWYYDCPTEPANPQTLTYVDVFNERGDIILLPTHPCRDGTWLEYRGGTAKRLEYKMGVVLPKEE
jgi:hypothetical protein